MADWFDGICGSPFLHPYGIHWIFYGVCALFDYSPKRADGTPCFYSNGLSTVPLLPACFDPFIVLGNAKRETVSSFTIHYSCAFDRCREHGRGMDESIFFENCLLKCKESKK